MTNTGESKEDQQRKEDFTETRMTHLFSYVASGGRELRLHDAEFRGRHYFDFRFYEKRTRGMVPTPRGIRLGFDGTGHLEDAVSRWKAFYQKLERKDASEKSKGESSVGESETND